MSKRLITEEFIEKAKTIHGDRYDYSNVEYINNRVEVCIICSIHGEFWQKPVKHLLGHGCHECAKINRRLNTKKNTQQFIEKAREVHGDKYDYSKVEYKRKDIKVCIICHEKDEFGEEHGEFWQAPSNHIHDKSGCRKCNIGKLGANLQLTTEEFIKRAREVHGDRYDYSKVQYVNAKTKVCIICPRHGEFWQIPGSHLRERGCPKCKSSKLEFITLTALNKNNIPYIFQYKIKELGKKSLDFYLPNHNLVIECQGEQHYIPTNFGKNISPEKTVEQLKERQELDKLKYDTCKSKSYDVVYYTIPEDFHVSGVNVMKKFYSDKTVFTHIDDLMKYISIIDTTDYVNNFYLLFQELYSITDNVVCEDNIIKCKNYAIVFHPINENMDNKEKSAIDRYYRKRKLKTIHIDENDFINDKEMLLNTLKSLINLNNDN